MKYMGNVYDMTNKKFIFLTGCAGFIGFHLSKKLLDNEYRVIGIDNLNDYYDVDLKKKRLAILKKNKNFFFKKIDISNKTKLKLLFERYKFDIIINLAAQAGVRYSINNPDEYFNSNIKGFYNLLELVKNKNIKHLMFASTSSVYGNQKSFPISENANTDHPESFYAASKKINEVMAYSYSNIFRVPITSLRFFTVYGPYGRPDMALFKFVKNIINNKSIKLFNNGNHFRDFTYIDDVVNNIFLLIPKAPTKKDNYYQNINICGSNPQSLKKYLNLIKINLNKNKIKFKNLPMQVGDVYKTYGNNKNLVKKNKYKSFSNIEDGIKKFIDWYKNFYKV